MSDEKKKKMGLVGLCSMGIGYVIGSGVFTMLPSVIGLTGRSVCLSMLLGSVIALLSVIPSVFLSSVIDLDGGPYTQNLALFPQVVAGVFGIIQMVAYLGYAAIGVGMANYTIQLVPGLGNMQKVVAMCWIILFFLLGIKGITLSAGIQNVMVVLLLIALGIYAFGGLPAVQPGFFTGGGFFSGGAKGFLMATALLSMSSMGASAMINFTPVAENPKRNIPIAMIVSTLVVAILYFLIAVVTGGVIPVGEVAGQNLGVVAETFLAKPLYLFFMIGGAMFALGTTLNANISAIPYPWLAMAEDGWLPKVILKKDKKFGYPYVLMGIVFVIGAIFPVVFGLDIATITSLFAFPSFIVWAIVAIAAFRIPKLYPQHWEQSNFHVPLPVFYLLTALSFVANSFLSYSYIDFLDAKTLAAAVVVIGFLIVIGAYRFKTGKIKSAQMDK